MSKVNSVKELVENYLRDDIDVPQDLVIEATSEMLSDEYYLDAVEASKEAERLVLLVWDGIYKEVSDDNYDAEDTLASCVFDYNSMVRR